MNPFTTTLAGDIARVTMHHGKANALDVEFCHALSDELDRLRGEARAVVLTGTGRIFSAGVDLVRLSEGGDAYVREFLPAFDRVLLTLFGFPAPLVAAVNGHAIAGGCIVACAADCRLMAAGPFRIGVPELEVGVPFPPSALEVLRYATPDRYVQELASAERMYSPEVAAENGLVHRVVTPGDLENESTAEARRLATLQRHAFSLTKTMLRRPVIDRIVRLNEQYGSEVLTAWMHPDTREAVRRYVATHLGR